MMRRAMLSSTVRSFSMACFFSWCSRSATLSLPVVMYLSLVIPFAKQKNIPLPKKVSLCIAIPLPNKFNIWVATNTGETFCKTLDPDNK